MTARAADSESLRATFGRRVRECRTRQGLTQQELSRRAGMHPAYVGGVERGERNISLDGVERLARALGVAPGELMIRSGGAPATGLEQQVRELAVRAADPSDLQLALDVARFVLDRLRQRDRLGWAAAERPGEGAR